MSEQTMKEKQIEEMAKATTKHCEIDNQCGSCHWSTCNECLAEILYNAGYRKQEWISVEDRRPKEFVSVLGYMTDAEGFPPVRECYMVGRVFFFPALKNVRPVSHWMPFPEPPKMKGGAE